MGIVQTNMPKLNPFYESYLSTKFAPYRHRLHQRESLTVSVSARSGNIEDTIEDALRRFDGNIIATADYLQLSPKQLRRIIDGNPNAIEEKDYTLHEIDTVLKGIDCHTYAIELVEKTQRPKPAGNVVIFSD